MIEALNLVKTYGSSAAVDNVSFSLGPGEILGLLGPNGAGKTTIMRMLAGYRLPDSGTVKINGISPYSNNGNSDWMKPRSCLGYLPENIALYGDMTVAEYLNFIAELRLIPKNEKPVCLEKTMNLCGLKTRQRQRIETLSRGYKQRVGLAQALLHDPEILILDEPMTGLDPNQIIEIRSLIRELGRKKSIIFSTHILSEAESVCTSYIILNEGKIAARGIMEPGKTSLEEYFSGLNSACLFNRGDT